MRASQHDPSSVALELARVDRPAAPVIPRRFEAFRVDVTTDREAVSVAPVGELDIATTGEVDQQLRELRDAGFAHVVIDLAQLTFIDCTGLWLLLRWDATARADGIDFALLEGPRAVQRVFEVSGLLDQLPFRSLDHRRRSMLSEVERLER